MQALKDYLALLGTAAGIIGALPGGASVATGTATPIPTIFPPGFGGAGQPIAPNYGGYFDYAPSGSMPSTATPSDNSVTIIVEGNVLDGDDFTDKVNGAVLDAFRQGRSQFPAGTLPG